MYHHVQNAVRPGAGTFGLPMTPSVALRSLHRDIERYQATLPETLDSHFFDGPIWPPSPRRTRTIGDPVTRAVAAYAAHIVTRSGLLTSKSVFDHPRRLVELDSCARQMAAAEHSLALDLATAHPRHSLTERRSCARMTLSIAAFWCDRRELIAAPDRQNPLLGVRPSDEIGQILYDFAATALGEAMHWAVDSTRIIDLRAPAVDRNSQFLRHS